MAGKKNSTPNVIDREINLSEVTNPLGTSTGAIVGCFPKGPINRPVLVTNDKDFIENFGQPVVSGSSLVYGYSAHAALEYLNESGSLYVVRTANPSQDYFSRVGIGSDCSSYTIQTIGASAGPLPDTLDSIYAIDNAVLSGANMVIAANSPGDWGNNLAVSIETLSSASDWFFSYDDIPVGYETSAIPSSEMSIASKVFKLSVFKKESSETWESFTQTKDGTSALSINPVETFYGTLESMTDGNNTQLFIKDVVNGVSKYIYVDVNNNYSDFSLGNNPYAITSAGEILGIQDSKLLRLSGGAQVAKTGLGSYSTAWEYFRDKELYNIGVVIVPDPTTSVKQLVCQNLVGYRKDCLMVTQSGTINDITVQSVLNAEKYGYTEPTYVALYAGWDKVYDKYNSKYIYLPECIFAAAVIARTEANANVFDAPAGLERGILSVVGKNVIWNEDQIGQLYDRNINTTRFFNGAGFVIWGQKTASLKASALDRINVRRLLIYIRKSISRSLMSYVLNVNNNARTRLRIWNNVDSFLSVIKSQGGLYDYEVVCNETNNTSQVIDNNELNVDIYVQPTKTVEYLYFTTVVTRTGVNFSEVRIR